MTSKAFGSSSKAFGSSSEAFGSTSEAFGTQAKGFGRACKAFGSTSKACGWCAKAFPPAPETGGSSQRSAISPPPPPLRRHPGLASLPGNMPERDATRAQIFFPSNSNLPPHLSHPLCFNHADIAIHRAGNGISKDHGFACLTLPI
jgi:hypothetical protein